MANDIKEYDHVKVSEQSYNETIYKQSVKGLEKYGQPMDPMEEGRDWLNMAEEELVDGHQYLVAEKKKRQIIVSRIRELLEYKDNSVSKVEISYWLDRLENNS